VKPIAITSGDPQGIGPDILLDIAHYDFGAPTLILGNEALFKERAKMLNKPFSFSKNIKFKNIPLNNDNEYVFTLLKIAANGCMSREYSAMVTCPVNKATLNQHQPFKGHTEWLCDFSGAKNVVMCLTNPKLTVALATTHLPLREVAHHITPSAITETIQIIRQQFPNKKILICGLNPHAGDSGLLGTEEQMIIEPAIKALKDNNIDGPIAADTAFAKALNKDIIVLAMYHDQGLAPIKTIDFENSVNVTLGLPFIRTSVDHGTAYDLVGTGKASSKSLQAAIKTAIGWAC